MISAGAETHAWYVHPILTSSTILFWCPFAVPFMALCKPSANMMYNPSKIVLAFLPYHVNKWDIRKCRKQPGGSVAEYVIWKHNIFYFINRGSCSWGCWDQNATVLFVWRYCEHSFQDGIYQWRYQAAVCRCSSDHPLMSTAEMLCWEMSSPVLFQWLQVL